MMNRRKSVPTKLNNLNDHWTSDKPLDYIPTIRRKSKRRSGNISNLYNIAKPKPQNKQFHVGEICIGTTHNLLPQSWSTCKASFKYNQGEMDMILLLDSTTVIVKLLMEYNTIKDIITSRIFAINVFAVNEELYFDIYFLNLPLTKFSKKLGCCIQVILSLLYDVPLHDHDDELEFDQSISDRAIDQLYRNVKEIRDQKLSLEEYGDVQHPKLRPQLRPYQADAVRWMLHKEQQICTPKDNIHPLYTLLKLKSGLDIYFDKYSGYVELVKPTVREPIRGGILADEMGLGKTVEVLACILLHQKSFEQDRDSCIRKEGDFITTSPVVEKARKRKMRENKTDSQTVHQSKKIKVPDNWVKGSSKKSQQRVALETWYINCLNDVKQKRTIHDGSAVQCICGSTDEDDTVPCKDCGISQHSSCVGFIKKFGTFRCSQCWMNQPLMECGATLIVTPISLRTQWCKEICKHVKGDLKVLQYEGASAVYPTSLLNYDVVITTYNVLQSELRLTEQEKPLSFRHQRRYLRRGCPLTRVKWWRLCLDEAQTVETPTTMVSEMAKKLSANFRWAVTGTPISKEISDLQGLIDYLQMEPYNDKYTWEQLLFNPYIRGQTGPLNNFLSQVMWRSSKDDVIAQIDIPKQTVKEHWLDFSAVEHYFYRCEHRSSSDAFLLGTRSYGPHIPLQTLDKSSLKAVLAPLLSLRQICTYPNSVGTRYLASKKSVDSMKDLLEALISKNTNESEEFLRIILSSLNGLAGIYLLLQIPEQAIEEYRKVLQLFTRFREEEKIAKLSVDTLLIIHAMHNLAEVLEIFQNTNNRTLRDDALRKDCAELEQKYIGKFINKSMAALQDSSLIAASVRKLQDSFILDDGKWYRDLFDWIYINDYTEELYTKIENAHAIANVEPSINIRNGRQLIYVIATWDENIARLRENAIDAVSDLYTHCPDDEFKIIVDKELAQAATDCHLRPQKKQKSKKKCHVCTVNDRLKSYELKLFSMSKRTVNFEDMSLKGSWKPTTEELIFRSILALGRTKNANGDLIKDGEVHINILETLKKEFKEVRKLWTHLDQQICAQDELDICKIRLRLKETSDEEEPTKTVNQTLKNLSYILENKLQTIHLLDEHELEYQRTTLYDEEMQNMARLEKNIGIRNYLETLRNQQYQGHNPDPCPICKNSLEQQWSILPCGHSYCLECIQLFIQRTKARDNIQCCICRAYHLVQEISYVKLGVQNHDSDGTKIEGNYSTKVESLTKLILELKAEDEDVKVLVFSSWLPVLTYVRTALVNNDILSELVTNTNLEKQIENFKDPRRKITVLLLPIHLGSKGLNLIEATHVILIEPLLNPADELQAVGRVHRIGQTKPTVVHKFFIKNTIEESIQKAISADTQNWEKNKLTIRQLMNLFITNETPSATSETSNQIQSVN